MGRVAAACRVSSGGGGWEGGQCCGQRPGADRGGRPCASGHPVHAPSPGQHRPHGPHAVRSDTAQVAKPAPTNSDAAGCWAALGSTSARRMLGGQSRAPGWAPPATAPEPGCAGADLSGMRARPRLPRASAVAGGVVWCGAAHCATRASPRASSGRGTLHSVPAQPACCGAPLAGLICSRLRRYPSGQALGLLVRNVTRRT